MVITAETFRCCDEISNRIYAQLNLIRLTFTLLRCCYGDQQRAPAAILNFIRGWKISASGSHPSDHPERSPIKRMARIQDLDHFDR